MIQTTLIKGPSAFSELAEEWDQLVSQSITQTPFQSLAYQKAWWTHLHPPNSQLYTIAAHQNDSLVGVGCFYELDGDLHFNGCIEETDYLDIIVSANHAEAVWAAFIDCLCQSSTVSWNRLDLCNIPEASPSRSILQQEAERRGFLFTESVNEVCPVISLPNEFETYLDMIDSKQRREIKRKLRKASAAGVTLKQVGPEDDIETAVSDFLDLLQKSTFEKRDWLNEGRRHLFLESAKAAMAAGTLQLLFLEVEGQKAAALFNFDYQNRIWVYNSGLDPDAFGYLSLGVVITALAIEWASENGRATFDFLRGDETYKYRFGAEDTHVYRQILTRAD